MLNWREKTDEQIVDFVMKLHTRLAAKRRVYEDLYDNAIKLFQPRRYDIQRHRAKGDKFGVSVYDPHPARSLSKFAVGFVGNTVSANDTDPWWIRFTAANQRLMQNDRVKQSLQEAEEQVRFGFAQSTFYQEMPQFMKDAGCTYACMTAKEDKINDRIVFQCRHPGDAWFHVNDLGSIDAWHFHIEMTAYDIEKMFGTDRLPDEIRKNLQGPNPDPFKSYKMLLAIYINESRRSSSLDATDKPYIAFYVLREEAMRKGHRLIARDGLDWPPVMLRLGTCISEDYPLSPALEALTQASYGNALAKYKLLAAHLSAQPAKRVSGTLRSQVLENQLNPGSMTFIDHPDEIIEAITDKINWPVTDAEMSKIGAYTDEVFYIQFFEMLTGGEEQPRRTAYEVSQMVNEKITMMGPTIEANEDQVLEPASSIIWSYETRAGRMPDMPEELYTYGNRKIQNQYMGRLAQLKRSIRQTKGTLEQLQILEVFGSLWPNALSKIREWQYIERAMVRHGMDQDLFRSDEEMAEIEAQMQQDEQMAKQLAVAESMSKMMPPGKTIEPNSPAALTGAAS